MLMSKKVIAAVDPLGPSGSVEHLEVVARFRITVSEYRPFGGLLKHPDLGTVALAPQLASDTGRAEMHVGGKRGGRRSPRQPALLVANLRQCKSQSAEFLRHCRKQIFRFA